MTIKSLLKVAGLGLASSLILAACGTSSSDSSSASSASSKQEVIFATVGTTNPFSFENADGNLTGFDVELAKKVFEGSDKYEVTFQKTEWTSIFAGLDSGKFQIAGNNISYSEERAAKYLYSYPTAYSPTGLIVPKGSDIKAYDDIAGHSTQVVQGTTSAQSLEKFNESHADNPVKLNYTEENITQMLHNLNDGKYDFKIFEVPSSKAIIADQGLDNLEIITLDSESLPYIYFVFGQDQADLQTFVNGRIKELYEDGTIEKLSQEFLGDSYLPKADDLK